jgi:AcrR family transcriptional regulator
MTGRSYRSEVRQQQADSTRQRILAAADRLVLAGGYPSMTIARLAEAAGVSTQTVYNAVGGKGEVVKAIYDVRLAGDDAPIAMNDRPEIQAVLAATSASECLRRYVDFGQLLYSRVGPLLGALLAHGTGADPVLATLTATTDRERRLGNTMLVTHLATSFGLPAGWSVERAVDLMWTMTSPQVADLTIVRCGWTLTAYGDWLADTLIHFLVEPD